MKGFGGKGRHGKVDPEKQSIQRALYHCAMADVCSITREQHPHAVDLDPREVAAVFREVDEGGYSPREYTNASMMREDLAKAGLL